MRQQRIDSLATSLFCLLYLRYFHMLIDCLNMFEMCWICNGIEEDDCFECLQKSIGKFQLLYTWLWLKFRKKKTRKMINKNAPLIYLPLRAPEFLFSVIVVRLIYANETKEKTKIMFSSVCFAIHVVVVVHLRQKKSK